MSRELSAGPFSLKLTAALLAIAMLGCVGASADSPSDGHKYPFWTALPVKDFAVLAEGHVRKRDWAIYAFRGQLGKEARDAPCIAEVHISRGIFGQASECGRPVPAGEEPVFTLTSSTFTPAPGAKSMAESVIGMTFASEVRRVSLALLGGKHRALATRLLSARQAEKARLAPFRYIAFATASELCVRRVSGFDKDGTRLFDLEVLGGCFASSRP